MSDSSKGADVPQVYRTSNIQRLEHNFAKYTGAKTKKERFAAASDHSRLAHEAMLDLISAQQAMGRDIKLIHAGVKELLRRIGGAG